MKQNSSEENHLKAIYFLQENKGMRASTNAIAELVRTNASSVTDMLKKLTAKGYIIYKRYHGAALTPSGKSKALYIIRKHRLWESFLVNKLDFNRSEVHEIAEELEHIKSDKLVVALDKYLGSPKFDPHGAPIPDKNGNYSKWVKIQSL